MVQCLKIAGFGYPGTDASGGPADNVGKTSVERAEDQTKQVLRSRIGIPALPDYRATNPAPARWNSSKGDVGSAMISTVDPDPGTSLAAIPAHVHRWLPRQCRCGGALAEMEPAF